MRSVQHTKLALLTVVFIAAGTGLHAQDPRLVALDSLRAMSLDSIPGVATVYFRPGDRPRALELQPKLQEFLEFWNPRLGMETRMRLAVLAPDDWRKLTPLPYGFPNNFGPPANLIPAPASPELASGVDTLLVERGDHHRDWLLVAHEGGHLLTWALLPPAMRDSLTVPNALLSTGLRERFRRLGSVPPWYWEYSANLFATAFFEAIRPAEAAAWASNARALTALPAPRFTHLDDWFGELMRATAPDGTPYFLSAEGGPNFGWYQGVVTALGAHVLAQGGDAVAQILRLLSGDSVRTTPQIIEELESAAPGTLALLDSLGVGYREQTQPDTLFALTNVTVIDGTGAPPMPKMTLVIVRDRIADIFADGAKPLPANTAVRNLSGRFVIPGLIDAHVHVSGGAPDEVLARLRRALSGGVTAVREMASNCRLLGEIAAPAARGEVEAADVYFSAHIVGPDVHTHPTHGAMVTPEVLEALGPGCVQILEGTIDAVEVVSAAKATGASALKIYGDLSADVARRLTAEAHRQGLRVWAHAAVFPARPGDLVEAGVDVMSHSDLFVWEAADRLPDHYYARMDLAPFERVTPTDPAVERVLHTMARRGTVLDATLLVYEPEGAPPGRVADTQAWAAARRWAAALTRRARELGVPVAAGTDAIDAEHDRELPNLHRELELLVSEAGFSPLEAITAATRNSARAVGAEATRGTIEIGKLADLVVLRADPTADIRNTREIELVIKRGRVVMRAAQGL